MTIAHELSERRLHQAEATINDFLANPIVAGTSFEDSAKDAKIKELTKKIKLDNMLKVAMLSSWRTREAGKDKEIKELTGEVERLKKELVEKEIQLHIRILPPPMDAPVVEPSYFDPLDSDIPSSRTEVARDTEEHQTDYTIVGNSVA